MFFSLLKHGPETTKGPLGYHRSGAVRSADVLLLELALQSLYGRVGISICARRYIYAFIHFCVVTALGSSEPTYQELFIPQLSSLLPKCRTHDKLDERKTRT